MLGQCWHWQNLWKQIFEEEPLLSDEVPVDMKTAGSEKYVDYVGWGAGRGIWRSFISRQGTALLQPRHKVSSPPTLPAASSLQTWIPACQLLPSGVPPNSRNSKQLCESNQRRGRYFKECSSVVTALRNKECPSRYLPLWLVTQVFTWIKNCENSGSALWLGLTSRPFLNRAA